MKRTEHVQATTINGRGTRTKPTRLLMALALVAGCGGTQAANDAGSNTNADLANGNGGVSDLAGTPPEGGDMVLPLSTDMTVYNPPNPSGLGPKPVVLGDSTNLQAPAAYVILAKMAITNVTGSKITGGNIAVSPAAATFLTGFSMTADASNQFSTSASVVAPGKLYAANYATPTPANLTAAVLAMQTAYTDAAGRQPADHINLSSGNLGGLTLAPGLYTWGSAVTVATDVTISGGANDVWIFQVAKTVDVSAAKKIVLSGGAQAKNIFWQVAGAVTIHANAHFEGVILCQTAITLQTTASMNGRALAQTLVAIDNNAITAP